MKTFPQFTLRELLFAVMFLALGLASLRAGGVLASITILLAIVLSMGMAIIAFVGRGELQAFAIGFLIPVIAYAASILAIGRSEFDPYEGKLPTSRLLLPVYQAIVQEEWIDSTGKVVPKNWTGTFNNRPGLKETPDRTTFMSLAHVLIAMLFGYAGARFAVVVYRRRSAT